MKEKSKNEWNYHVILKMVVRQKSTKDKKCHILLYIHLKNNDRRSLRIMLQKNDCKKMVKNGAMQRVIVLLLLLPSLGLALGAAELKGLVKDDRNTVLPAVTVMLKNTSDSTVTDKEGKFVLTVPDTSRSVVLVFMREGFHPLEKRVTVDDNLKTFKLLFLSSEYLVQKITVTAMNSERKTVNVPMAEFSISDLDIREKIPENVVESLSDTPGVHFVGAGGFSVTPSLRGLARFRVLVLVDGDRVTSDRRVGASASFVPPVLVERVEVVRSASSVFYGSDAIGGVVNIITRNPGSADGSGLGKNMLNLNYNTVDEHVNTGFTYHLNPGKWNIATGFQFSRASDYKAPEKTVNHSGYSYYSGMFDISYTNQNRKFFLGYMAGFGKDIGKPDRVNDPRIYSVVPSESDQFIRMGYSDMGLIKDGSLELSMFINPQTYNLDKMDLTKKSRQSSNISGLNLGFRSALKKTWSDTFSMQAGLEWFSRQNVDQGNENEDFKTGVIDLTYPLRDGVRNDYSLFMSFDYLGIKTLEVNGGLRYTFFSMDAVSNGVNKDRSTGSYSFFLGLTKKIGQSVSVFCNVARAFRFPTLGESYYTGLTGRKWVIGNENLKPERSLNVEAGIKMAYSQFSLGLYGFAYRIDDMIERYVNAQKVYAYDNIVRGTINGVELEMHYLPVNHLDLFGHAFYYKGKNSKSTVKEALNDVPAPRFLLGSKLTFDRLWFEVTYLHSFKKSDPGPAELANKAYDLMDIKGGYYFSSRLFLYVKAANIFNQNYYANADPDIPLSKGFNFSAGFHFYF